MTTLAWVCLREIVERRGAEPIVTFPVLILPEKDELAGWSGCAGFVQGDLPCDLMLIT